jgi:hypothetical protein
LARSAQWQRRSRDGPTTSASPSAVTSVPVGVSRVEPTFTHAKFVDPVESVQVLVRE